MRVKWNRERGGLALGASWEHDDREIYIVFLVWSLSIRFKKPGWKEASNCASNCNGWNARLNEDEK